MFYGQFQDDTWGSDDETTRFKTYIEIPTDEWIDLISEAGNQSKIIDHDSEGHPILVDPPEPSEKEKANARINELKNYLASTDYVAAKIAEGVATREEYAEVLAKRASARAEINECYAILQAQDQEEND